MLKRQKKKIINNQDVACFQTDLNTFCSLAKFKGSMVDIKRKLLKLKTQLSWKAEYSFLQFSSKENLFCKTSLKFEDKIKSSKNHNLSFVEGCSNFQKIVIVEHAKTEIHNKICEFEDMQEAQKFQEKYKKMTLTANTPIGESLLNMGKLSEDRQQNLERLFHIAYHTALRGHPYTNFVHELEVQKLHNVEFFKSGSYENKSVYSEFINFCSRSIFNQRVKEKLQKTNFISISHDGSTDSAVIKKNASVLFADLETFHPTTSFFSLRDLPSQDAEAIFSAIKKAFANERLEHILRNIVFSASDGASVNSVIKKGLISLVRKETPWVGFVWCFTHRLELVSTETSIKMVV